MIDSTSCGALGLVCAAPDVTIVLAQASSSLSGERAFRLEHRILRPAATHPAESTIVDAAA